MEIVLNVNANVNINAPDLCVALNNLAVAMSNRQSVMAGTADAQSKSEFNFKLSQANNEKASAKETKSKPEQKSEPTSASKPEPEKSTGAESETEITLEQIRAKFLALANAGMQMQAKQLLTSIDCNKVTEIPKEKYPEVIAEVDTLLEGEKA